MYKNAACIYKTFKCNPIYVDTQRDSMILCNTSFTEVRKINIAIHMLNESRCGIFIVFSVT